MPALEAWENFTQCNDVAVSQNVKKDVEEISTGRKSALMAATDSDPFPRLLRGLLRPLVRTLIARGFTAPAFYRLLKRVYVEVAHDDFRIDNTAPTDSRISLLTGVHRKDVRLFLQEGDEGWEDSRRRTATFATVLGQWIARPDFTDGTGQPLPLPRAGAANGIDFESLVRLVNTDIRPRTVLDELMRQDLVTEGADGLLTVSRDAVSGPSEEDGKLVFFATNVGDHLAAASENLIADEPPFFERAVFYTRLTEGSVDSIEASARAKAQTLLEDVNRESAAAQDRDRDAADNTTRYRMGVYFYREAGSGVPEQASADAASDGKAQNAQKNDDGD